MQHTQHSIPHYDKIALALNSELDYSRPGVDKPLMASQTGSPAVIDLTPSVANDGQFITESVIQDDCAVKPVTKRKSDPETRERCKSLYLRGLRPQSIAAETGVSASVIHVWINRHGWKVLRNATERTLEKRQMRVVSIQPAAPSNGSAALRDTFASVLQKVASKMDTLSPKANLKDIRRVGKALEPLVRSAKIVHGWGTEGATGVVVTEMLSQELDDLPSVAITAEVAQVDCGSNTTTGCSPTALPEQTDAQERK